MKITRSHYGDGNGDPVKWFRGKVAKIDGVSEDVLKEVMEDAAYMMLDNIATRGTAKSGKAGRIESRKMYNDVSAETKSFGEGKVRGRFGWLKNQESYYGLQEGGFEHSPGVTVEGMYALADAADWAMKTYREDMQEALKNV